MSDLMPTDPSNYQQGADAPAALDSSPAAVSGGIAAVPQPVASSMADALGANSSPAPTNNPSPSNPTTTPQRGGVWREILAGALSGLAGSAGTKSFGGGLSAGAAGAFEQQRQARLDTLAAQNQQSEIKYRDAQSAQLVSEAALSNFKLQALPQQIQDTHNSNALEMMKNLQSMGFQPVAAVGDHDQASAALSSLTQSHGSVPPLFSLHIGDQTVAYDLSHLADDDSGRILDTVNKYGRVLGRPDFTAAQWAQVPATDKAKIINDSLGTMNVVPDPSKIGAQIAEAKFRAATYDLQPFNRQDPDIKAGLQRNINMLQAAQKDFDNHAVNMEARKAAAKTAAEAAAKKESDKASNWLPKVGADEKKKAELAENIGFNANEVASILLKRPDIVGAVAGRYSNAQQMIGNNDPDISALGVHVHNLAMANSGVHGFRSQEGVESYERAILNNFKNGPQAVAGALNASVGSVQTFIDAARPDTYKTHSKQGGALRGMRGAQ